MADAFSEIVMEGPRNYDVPGAKHQASAGRVDGQAIAPMERPERRMLIVSDIRIPREGLAEVLARDSAFLIVGIASGLEDALAAAASQPPQIILIDAALPEGVSAVARLRER